MTKRVYLVDTENVNSTWKELLPLLTGNDRLILFYTANSPYISYPDLSFILRYPDSFEMVECYTGSNGLDFQLVSYLGYLLKTAARTEYVIVSNDTGYDAVIRFWNDRERTVSRMTSRQLIKMKNQHPNPADEEPLTEEAPSGEEQTAAEVPAAEEEKPAKPQRKSSSGRTSRRRGGKAKTEEPKPSEEAPAEAASPAEPEAEQPAEGPAAPEPAAEAQPAAEKAPEARSDSRSRRKKKPAPEKAAEPAPKSEPEAAEAAAEEELPEEESPVIRPGLSADQIIREAVGSECEDATFNWILEMLGKYDPRHFSLIHSDLQKHFGQEQGVVYYKQLRPVLRKFYSAAQTEK